MESITPHVSQVGSPFELGIGWAGLVENDATSLMVDPCYGWQITGTDRNGSPRYTPQFEALVEHVLHSGRTVRWIFLTHSHMDRLENLEFINRQFSGWAGHPPQHYFDYQLVVHDNSPLRSRVGLRLGTQEDVVLDGRKYVFLHTPGHSEFGDDVSLFLPEDRVLFCGDLCQPQGPSFERVDSVTPFQSFADGDMAMSSLELLLLQDFLYLKSASGHTYSAGEGRNALEVTLAVLRRLDELAHKLVRENPRADASTVCEWIYDTLCWERGFDRTRALWRKTARTVEGMTEYEVYDRPEIEYFVRKYI